MCIGPLGRRSRGTIGVIREAEAMMNIRQAGITMIMVVIRKIRTMGTAIKNKIPDAIRLI
jgi:hypothetical protein